MYNLGKFRFDGENVYYMLFKVIPIKITTIKGGDYRTQRLKIFHDIETGFVVKNKKK